MTAFIHGRGTAPVDASIATETVLGQVVAGVEAAWSIVDQTNTTRTKLFRMIDSGVFVAATGMTISAFGTAGVIHNNASGQFSSSLIVNADITNGTISAAKLATGGVNTVMWSDGATNAFVGNPILSTSLQVGTGATSLTLKQYQALAGQMVIYAGTTPAGAAQGTNNWSYFTNSDTGVSSTAQLNSPDPLGFVTLATGGFSRVQVVAGEVRLNKTQAYKLVHLPQTTDLASFDLTIESQGAFGTNHAPGNLIFNTPAPTGTGAAGVHRFQSRGTNVVQLGEYPSFTTYGTIWLGNAPAAANNWSISGDGLAQLNFAVKPASSGFLFITDTGGATADGVLMAQFAVSGGANKLIFGTNVTAAAVPVFIQAGSRTPLNATATADMTIQGMTPASTAVGAARNSGSVIIEIPAATTGGETGYHKWTTGGVQQMVARPFYQDGTQGAPTIWLGNAAPTATNYTFSMETNAPVGSPPNGSLYLNAQNSGANTAIVIATGNGIRAYFDHDGTNNRLQMGFGGADAIITIATRSNDSHINNLIIRGMAPSPVGTGANLNSGSIIYDIVAPGVSPGVQGIHKFTFAGTAHAQFWPHPQFPTLVSALWLGPGVTPGNTNFSLATNISGQSTLVNAPSGQVILTIANVTAFSVQSLTKYGLFSNVATWSTGTIDPSAVEPDGSLYTKTGSPNGDIFLRRNSAWISLLNGSGFVTSARQIIAGAGMTGGGDLSADRTLNVIAHADGSIVVHADDVQVGVLATDAQHGNRGGGALHTAVTNAAAGFAVAITAANRVLLSTSGTAAVWGQVDLTTMAGVGAANTVLWSNGSANSFTGSPILSTSLTVGINPSTVGAIRLTNATGVFGRNAANSVNITLVTTDSNDRVVIGSSATAVRISTLGPGVIHSDDAFGTLSSSSIIGADIANSTITTNKLSPGTNGQVIMTNGTPAAVWTTYAGDVTGTPAASTVVGLTGVANVTTQHGTTISTPNTEQVFIQTGDTFGTTRLRLRNRASEGGITVENAGLDLSEIRFVGTTNTAAGANIRLEGRVGPKYISGSQEFQFGLPGDPSMVLSANGTGGEMMLRVTKLNFVTSSGTINVGAGQSFVFLRNNVTYAQFAPSGITTAYGPSGQIRKTLTSDTIGTDTAYDHLFYGSVNTSGSATVLSEDFTALIGGTFSYTAVVTITAFDAVFDLVGSMVLTQGGFHLSGGGSATTATDTVNLTGGVWSASCTLNSAGVFSVTVNVIAGGTHKFFAKVETIVYHHS